MTRPSVHRMLKLLDLLHGPGRTVVKAAAELKCSTKTLYRDIGALRELGLPIGYDAATHCWYLDEVKVVPEWYLAFKRIFG